MTPDDAAPWQVHSLGDLTPVTVRHHDASSAGIVDVGEAAREAIEAARASKHGKGTRVLWTGPHQRLVVVGLAEGAQLAEHASPPAASLHVLAGTVRLHAGQEAEWVVNAGEVVAIPPERHAVDAVTESAFLLTVSLDPHPRTPSTY